MNNPKTYSMSCGPCGCIAALACIAVFVVGAVSVLNFIF